MKDIKIESQIKLGFLGVLILVIILGTTAYIQTDKINRQTEEIYNHPLQVRRAISNFRANIRMSENNLKEWIHNSHERRQIPPNFGSNEIFKANTAKQLDILYQRYLGPPSDIDSLQKNLILWNAENDAIIHLLTLNKIAEAVKLYAVTDTNGNQTEAVFKSLDKIDNYAENRANAIYSYSSLLRDSLNKQLILCILAIILLSIIIGYTLLRNIKKPVQEIIAASARFHDGDLAARSHYVSKNELGILSRSFNVLVDGIQINLELAKKLANLAASMSSKYDTRKFFQVSLQALCLHTESEMAAVYLLSNDKKNYQYFESIGIDKNLQESFAADRPEGEFGAALASKKVTHIKEISADTRFVFHTVTGNFIPREIITIPIVSKKEVVAILSLASVRPYEQAALQLIDSILVILSSRIEGVLAYQKISEFSRKLEVQNIELEAQKTELASQSAELTQQNTELEMQKKQLSEASQLKTNFLSNMSHELRTPLNSVIALSGVLNRRLVHKISEEENSYLEVIERNGKHLLELINDILDISRIEAGREEVEISQFNINQLVSDLSHMIRPQADQKNIELLHTTATEIFIRSDFHKCRHILQNLIANAVKFTEKGRVELEVIEGENSIDIKVRDTGIGISEAHQPHIFDEFRQADGSTSRRFGGTGLGLAIARKYANLLGGTVSVKSALGQGSEFTFSLPLQYAAETIITEKTAPDAGFHDSTQAATEEEISAFGTKTILLVEDSEPAIIQIRDFLEESGYQIIIARNGTAAIEILSQTIPEGIILDLMMPGIDGFQVLKRIRETESTLHIPVLILTAKHISKEELSFLKHNHIYQLIQKGDVKREEFLHAVKSMLIPKTAPVNIQPILQNIKGKPLVLVVEDNPDNMITVKALLSDNFTIIEATDGLKGITMAKQFTPDLILMDIALPVMDGIRAFTIIRNDLPTAHIPVIALTASAMTSDRETILADGFDAYIAKPIDASIFYQIINEVLYGK